MIYLDYNATSPVDPAVLEAMLPFFTTEFGNPSSGYPPGRRAKQALEDAREKVARAIGAKPGEVVFTSGGTESNNMVFKGMPRTRNGGPAHFVTTRIEHPAVTNPCIHLVERGMEADFVPVDGLGIAHPEDLRRALGPNTVLVSIMHANNETGAVQPVSEVAAIARSAGVYTHTDAAQSVGKIPTNVDALGVDFLTIAGHKVYAPKGIGALYIREGAELTPLMHGAAQEAGRRAGTENVALAVGLGVAMELAARDLEANAKSMRATRDLLHRELASRVDGLALNGPDEPRLPNTLNVSFPGVAGGDVLAAAPELCASTGAACHAREVSISHVLAAMGLERQRAVGAVRLSVGRHTTGEDVRRAAEILARAWAEVRAARDANENGAP
ncbi:MAG: cysteine desulfurase family protein [Desulfatibacillaceae bacterium]